VTLWVDMQYLNCVLMSTGFNCIKNATISVFLSPSHNEAWNRLEPPRLPFAQFDDGRIG
jgi:hypothetical protein